MQGINLDKDMIWAIDFDECVYRKTPHNEKDIHRNRHAAFLRALKKTVCSDLEEKVVEDLFSVCAEQKEKNNTSIEHEVFTRVPFGSKEQQKAFFMEYVMNDEEVRDFAKAVRYDIADFSLFERLPGKKIIFTDNKGHTVRRFFECWKIDFNRYFHDVFDMVDGKCLGKRERTTYDMFSEKYTTPHHRIVLVDDNIANIDVAKAAGWTGVHTKPNYTINKAIEDILKH